MSGNKPPALLALMLTLLLSSGCELFRPADTTRPGSSRQDRDRDRDDLDPVASRRVYDEVAGQYVYVSVPTQPMDTVVWREATGGNPPITQDDTAPFVPVAPATAPEASGMPPVRQTGTGRNGSRLLTGYRVDYVLPFLTDRYGGDSERIDPNSLWALHFYSGAEMAMDEFNGQDTYFDVRIQDSRANPARMENLTESAEFEQSQLVIGPYLKQNVTVAAEAVRGLEQVLISPYSAATGVSERNVNYVQVNPTLETHLRQLLGHAYRSQGADRIVLVAGPDQRTRLAYFQDEYRLLNEEGQPPALDELIIDGTVPDLGNYLSGRRTVFMVPVYEDEGFVDAFLRKLYQTVQQRGGSDGVAVYGLPQWLNYEQVSATFMNGTNVHVSSSVFINPLDERVRRFREDFYDRYQTLPRDEAFIGYDITRYFLRMAARYGTRFQFALPDNPEELMHTSFRFSPVAVIAADATSLEEASIDRFENRFVNILRYTDFAWRRVN